MDFFKIIGKLLEEGNIGGKMICIQIGKYIILVISSIVGYNFENLKMY